MNAVDPGVVPTRLHLRSAMVEAASTRFPERNRTAHLLGRVDGRKKQPGGLPFRPRGVPVGLPGFSVVWMGVVSGPMLAKMDEER